MLTHHNEMWKKNPKDIRIIRKFWAKSDHQRKNALMISECQSSHGSFFLSTFIASWPNDDMYRVYAGFIFEKKMGLGWWETGHLTH